MLRLQRAVGVEIGVGPGIGVHLRTGGSTGAPTWWEKGSGAHKGHPAAGCDPHIPPPPALARGCIADTITHSQGALASRYRTQYGQPCSSLAELLQHGGRTRSFITVVRRGVVLMLR